MARYFAMRGECLKKLEEWITKLVSRKENRKADTLAEIAIILSINRMVMLFIYLNVVPSITPMLICNTG